MDLQRTSAFELGLLRTDRVTHPFFGPVTVCSSASRRQRFLCCEHIISGEEEARRFRSRLQGQLVTPNLLGCTDYSCFAQTCQTQLYFLFRLFYEHFERSLAAPGWFLAQPGLEVRLLHLFYQSVLALAQLQSQERFHGLVGPEAVLEAGPDLWKLATRLQPGPSPERSQLERFLCGQEIFVAPELFEAMRAQRKQLVCYNPWKADVFAMGLVLLQTGLGTSVQSVYGSEGFVTGALTRLLEQFREKFAAVALLHTAVACMLEVRQEKRPDALCLKKALVNYEQVCEFLRKEKASAPAPNPSVPMRRISCPPVIEQEGVGTPTFEPTLQSSPTATIPRFALPARSGQLGSARPSPSRAHQTVFTGRTTSVENVLYRQVVETRGVVVRGQPAVQRETQWVRCTDETPAVSRQNSLGGASRGPPLCSLPRHSAPQVTRTPLKALIRD